MSEGPGGVPEPIQDAISNPGMSWLRATFEDFEAVDFEAPIRGAGTADVTK